MMHPGPPFTSALPQDNYNNEHFANKVSKMSIQPFSYLKTSVVGKSSNENSSFSFSCADERISFLRSSWISRLWPEMPLPNSCKEREHVTGFGPFQAAQVLEQPKYGLGKDAREEYTDKRLVISPLFRYQQQMKTKFLSDNKAGGGVELARDKATATPAEVESHIRSAPKLKAVQLVASSSHYVARRIGSASHASGGDPSASNTFGDRHVSQRSTVQRHHDRKTPGFLGEEEEHFSFWNLGRLERSNFVSSVCPMRAVTLAHGRKRNLHTYDHLVSSKTRKFCH